MLQVHACVSVHCHQCGDGLGGPAFEAHYPSEAAALDMVAAQGWRVGPGGRLWCSACGPVLTCELEGHEFIPWRRAPNDDAQVLSGGEVGGGETVGGDAGEYRYCRRCCVHESRPGAVLVGCGGWPVMASWCALCAGVEGLAVSDFVGWLPDGGCDWGLCAGCGWHLFDDAGRPACAPRAPTPVGQACGACLALVCPDCGCGGPHHPLGPIGHPGWVECGGGGCGASWQLAGPVAAVGEVA